MDTLSMITAPLHFLLLYALPFAACVHSALVAYHNRKRSSGAMFFFAAISMAGAGLIVSSVAHLDFGDYLPGYVFSYGLLIALGHYFAKRDDADADDRQSTYPVAGQSGLVAANLFDANSGSMAHHSAHLSQQTDPAYHFMADNIHHTSQDHWRSDPTESWRPDNNHHVE